MPKISVLMPVFNAALYLREAMDSILNQTFEDFELIVIDDGSTDASGQIIESYNDHRICHVKNKKNLGLVDSLNRGIEEARGEYIARMDADDISLPDRFSRQVSLLDERPEIGACGTAYRYFGDKESVETLPTDPRQAFTLLASTSCLGHPTSMIRRSLLDRHGIRYERTFGYAADYAFWIRLSQVSELCSLPEPLLLYRWHASSMTRTDQNRVLARAKARILWHELFLRSPIEDNQKKYLEEHLSNRKIFRAGKKMILNVLEDSESTHFIDRAYYGKLMATDWELKFIDRFGLAGLVTCLASPGFRTWSRVTSVGLVAHYLAKFGTKLKR